MTTIDDELQDAIERGELEPHTLGGTLADLVDIVRQSRERTEGVFPLPDVDSCIDYAITEAGEYLDAVLREKRDTDKRNRDKEHDARKELGQAAYMVCSALIQMPPETLQISYVGDESIHDMFLWLCLYRTADDETALPDALQVYVNLCRYEGWEPADLMRETCAAFERKHLPVVRGYDFEPVGELFRYPVLSAEDAQAQGEQAE